MAEDDHDHEQAAARRLAEKINVLFSTVHPPDRKPYTSEEVANWLAEHDGPTISANYIRYLRRAEKTNPGVQQLRAIARFFRVDVAYLIGDDEHSQRTHEQLLELGKLRHAKAHGIALRVASMDERTQEWLLQMVKTMPTSDEPADDPNPGS